MAPTLITPPLKCCSLLRGINSICRLGNLQLKSRSFSCARACVCVRVECEKVCVWKSESEDRQDKSWITKALPFTSFPRSVVMSRLTRIVDWQSPTANDNECDKVWVDTKHDEVWVDTNVICQSRDARNFINVTSDLVTPESLPSVMSGFNNDVRNYIYIYITVTSDLVTSESLPFMMTDFNNDAGNATLT